MECGGTVSWTKNIKTHQRRCGDVRKMKCETCSEEFVKVAKLNNHRRKHKTGMCKYCENYIPKTHHNLKSKFVQIIPMSYWDVMEAKIKL